MTRKNRLKLLATWLLGWLAVVACKINIPDFFGGLGSALRNMFNSIARSISF